MVNNYKISQPKAADNGLFALFNILGDSFPNSKNCCLSLTQWKSMLYI